jgi:uncharacterized protein YjiS (DUF1127 family)
MKMRNYVLTQAQSQQSYGVLTMVVRVVRNWKHHRDLEKLLAMEDYLLRDMGLTRDVVKHLAGLPLTVDVDWERERVMRGR